MSTGLPMAASAGRNAASRARVAVAELGDVEPGGVARVGGENAGPAGVGDDRDAAARRQRLRSRDRRRCRTSRRSCRRGSRRLAGTARRRPTSLAASAAVWLPAARDPPRVRPAFTATIGLRPADAPRDAREAARIAERFEIQQDDAVAGSPSQYWSRSLPDTSALLPTLTNVDRPTLPFGGELENREAQRAALRREARRVPRGGKIGENDALRRTVGIGVEQPHAVGADHPHAVAADAFDQLAAAARGRRRRPRRSRR